VKPDGKLRFAMTCRFIRPETIADPVARQDAIEKGKVPEGIQDLAYRGIDSDTPDTTVDDAAIAVNREDVEDVEVAEATEGIIEDAATTNATKSDAKTTGALINDIIEAAAAAAAVAVNGDLDTAITSKMPATGMTDEVLEDAADASVDYADSPRVGPLSAEDELFSRVLEFEQYIQANQDLVKRLSLHQNATLVASALRIATMANQVAAAIPSLEDV
jgi:hypothetical protein